ncbi:hypothetical protein QEN19_000256 [Hanseniaspora menglaensis]
MSLIKVARIPYGLLTLQSQRVLTYKGAETISDEVMKRQISLEKIQMESELKLEFQKSIKDLVALINPLQDSEANDEDIKLEQDFLESCSTKDMNASYGKLKNLLDNLSKQDGTYKEFENLGVKDLKLLSIWSKNLQSFYGSDLKHWQVVPIEHQRAWYNLDFAHYGPRTDLKNTETEFPWFGEFNWTVRSKFPVDSKSKYKLLPLLSRKPFEELAKMKGLVNHYEINSERKNYWKNNLQKIDPMSGTVIGIIVALMIYNSLKDYYHDVTEESIPEDLE